MKFLLISISIFFISNIIIAQQVIINLKNGKQITGELISIKTSEVCVDPEGAVSLLTLFSKDIFSLTFSITGETLNFPITEEQIPSELKNSKKEKNLKSKSSYYNHYSEMYLFGGFSSQKTIAYYTLEDDAGNSYTFPMIYKNGGLGGLGLEYLYDSPNKSLDYLIDMEVAFIGAKFLTEMFGEEVELLSGLAMSMDIDFNLYPFQARNTKYPTPFAFFGLGFRLIGMESTSEIHGALPFGVGLRWQLSKGVALQIKERFIYSKLKDVDSFILPETRFELHFNINKW
jgi:hypothetical protein